ncbi:hypothetical protein AVEN_247885-1 [Araneus ventricosus]|uniref:Uncharacterized protein n=1 Tax=Araneus ventricosus TaxID=182803 RepID=A0A4Y2HTJ2_ARAVE|nr:hypothetical protein AVEN_247885-1 [Araneus ventricosus]
MRKEEQEVAERRHQEEIDLRKQEFEERKRKDEMEFELQKIRLGAEGRSLNSNSVANQNVNIDNVNAENINVYVVPDDAQSVDLIIGRTWLDLPQIAYTNIGERVHIGYRKDELFINFPIDEKVNPVCLERLETAQA